MTAARKPLPWLAPLGRLYLSGSALKNVLYDRKVWRPQRVTRPVICVGNLTAGGTGKTPAVAWLVEALTARGHRVAVVSRGYGGRPPQQPLDVWTDQILRCDAKQAGDEAVWIAQAVRPFAVIVGVDRVRAAQRAESLGATVIVLDDGFQHRRLHRDLDLLLVDAVDPLGGGRGLPAGSLRESPQGARRAAIVIVTRASQAQFAAGPPLPPELWPAQLRDRLSHGPLVLAAQHAPQHWIDSHGATHPAHELAGQRVYWACGIAHPDAFTNLLRQLGADLVGGRPFADHHPFMPNEVTALQDEAARVGATQLITTAKDAARWPATLTPPGVLTIRFDVHGEALALQRVERVIATAR